MRTTRINPPTVSPPMAAGYSHAVRVELGDAVIVYVSGQMAFDIGGALVGVNDMETQTRKVFENLREILSANMATFGDVVKMDTYVTDLAGLSAIREVRREFLGDEPPASTLVEISGLVHPDALIEIDVVAVTPTA
jgi:enamine deaminase RidA (YjgF/YER057c/UK114 family)